MRGEGGEEGASDGGIGGGRGLEGVALGFGCWVEGEVVPRVVDEGCQTTAKHTR